MTIKLVVGGFILHIISAYAPQAGLGEEEKRRFWEDLDEMMGSIPSTEKLFIGGDFNGHIGSISEGYDDVHGGWGFGDRNGGGVALLDFAKAFELMCVIKLLEILSNYKRAPKPCANIEGNGSAENLKPQPQKWKRFLTLMLEFRDTIFSGSLS
ncbi:uncharacterized protein LOC132637944 [Lycium barbarum]|uniref:uncharacterized protein LOC132637944 n=1 Tax=Lycium barbarum TaxID=112863 RepID=UPI00293ED2C1|nr:uncharacterized protein LOC132637944 [Lycium barbarum]